MLYPDLYESVVEPKNKLEETLYKCDSSKEASVVALVSKMFAVPVEELPENKKRPVTAEELRERGRAAREARKAAETNGEASTTDLNSVPVSTDSNSPNAPLDAANPSQLDAEKSTADLGIQTGETLLGFARIYSGTIVQGSSIYCVLPKYDNSLEPSHPRNQPHVVTATVERLYTMMGRELAEVREVHAGNVFAIKGLEGKVWRNATICAPASGGVSEGSDLKRDEACLLNLGGSLRTVSSSDFC